MIEKIKKRTIKISYEITAVFLISSILPILVLSSISFFIVQDSIKKNTIEELELLLELRVERINLFYEEFEKDIRVMQNFYNIQLNLPVLSENIGNVKSDEFIQATELLDNHFMSYREEKELIDLLLFDKNGKLLYTTQVSHSKDEVGKKFSGEMGEIIKKGRLGVTISKIFPSKFAQSGFETIIAAPVFDSEDNLIGITAFGIDMGPIYDAIQETLGLGETGETLIARKMESHKDIETEGHASNLDTDHVLFLNPLRHDPDAAFSREIAIDNNQIIPMQLAVNGSSGSGESVDYRGKKIIASWIYVPDRGWGIVAKIDTDEALAPINIIRNAVIITIIIISIFMIPISYILSLLFSKPIISLAKVATEVGAGNLNVKAEGINRSDELGVLANTFNKMIEDLQELISRSNEKIEELERFNKITVDRELKMVELKKKIKAAQEEISKLKGNNT